MPRVKPLTDTQKRAEEKKKADIAFLEALALYKLRHNSTDEAVAGRIGMKRWKISKIKKDPGSAYFEDVRSIMHSLGASAEDWLRLGGFKVG